MMIHERLHQKTLKQPHQEVLKRCTELLRVVDSVLTPYQKDDFACCDLLNIFMLKSNFYRREVTYSRWSSMPSYLRRNPYSLLVSIIPRKTIGIKFAQTIFIRISSISHCVVYLQPYLQRRQDPLPHPSRQRRKSRLRLQLLLNL